MLVNMDKAAEAASTNAPQPVKGKKKASKRKNTPAPEGPELLSPGKFPKPNSMDEGIQANYLDMLPFYTT